MLLRTVQVEGVCPRAGVPWQMNALMRRHQFCYRGDGVGFDRLDVAFQH